MKDVNSRMAISTAAVAPSNAYGVGTVSKNLIVLMALYFAAPRLANVSNWYAWALTPAIGLVVYRLTMVMHDCGHATLFSPRHVNVVVGKLLGFLTGVDFFRFRQRHWEHHKRFGVAGDPQGFHYLGISDMRRWAFFRHLMRPLLGWNLQYVASESLLSASNLRTILRNGEIFILLAVQSGVFLLITGVGSHPSLALMPPVAAATFGLFFSQLRGIAEHGVRGTGEKAEGLVRSHPGDWLSRLFLYDVNFNFHEEHHLFPDIPSHQLPQLFELNSTTRTDRPTMWKTLGNMMNVS